ncbi:hypothetical protein GOP47_0027662 [Adiantum capillus-veneris]|nr:hypothetical protein GOP47_0027662 [Adiantum capillus-veneris]
MGSVLDSSLEDLMKARKEGGRVRAERGKRNGYGDFPFGSAALGPIRRDPLLPSFRPSPYTTAKRDVDGPWKHDLFEAEPHYNGSTSEIETGTKVFISNLDYGVSDEDIKELFSEVGDVKWSSVRYDRSGRSEGCAEVLYSRRVDAETAVKRYQDVLLDGKPMKVEIKGTNQVIPRCPRETFYGLRGQQHSIMGNIELMWWTDNEASASDKVSADVAAR